MIYLFVGAWKSEVYFHFFIKNICNQNYTRKLKFLLLKKMKTASTTTNCELGSLNLATLPGLLVCLLFHRYLDNSEPIQKEEINSHCPVEMKQFD